MKKVFAFLSTLLLTIAFVGIFAYGNPAAAANKITEDPTLAEDEIPVYIMDSIYSTFPNYYDNEAAADPNWAGPARMYPWNETRLRVAQFDDKGQPTGKYYAVYFSGHTSHLDDNKNPVIGAGKNILFWNVNEEGKVVVEKYSDGKKTDGGQASDPSLSHMRTNISGQDIVVDTKSFSELGDEGSNFFNRSIVFDAEGRIIRAIGLDTIYAKDATDYVMAPEYCYVNGVVTKMEDGVTCDKVLKEQVDEEGNPILGEDGQPVLVESDEDNILYSRFVYEYFDEKPENVNEVAYLSEGWDAKLWDYVYPEGDGWIAIAFVGGADNDYHKTKGDQITAYQATLKAQYIAAGMAEAEADTKAATDANGAIRDCVKELRIPAGGWTFDYGYLDKGKATNDMFFNDTVIKGYKYGRQVVAKQTKTVTAEDGTESTEEVNVYAAAQRTYNFSVSGLYFNEKVINNESYQLLNGQSVVEIMQGTTYNPAANIIYTGVMRYWSVENDLTSYKSDDQALEFYIKASKNGGSATSVVAPPTGYRTQKDVAEDFVKDWNEYADENSLGHIEVPLTTWTDAEIVAKFVTPLGWDLAGTSNSTTCFLGVEKYWTKWSWMFEYIANNATTNQALITVQGNQENGRSVSSPGSFRDALYGFLCESPLRSISNTWANTCADWSNGNATKWLDSRTNKELWEQYEIDATMAAPNDNWVLTYEVKNTATGVSSDLTVKYVVVDSYTPIIKVDKNLLTYIPKVVSDLVVCDPIDIYAIVSAYDAQYNGVDILGNDISQNIEFETELNFANPKEGAWPVVATIYNNARTKKAVAKFTIEVKDITAPNAVTRKVVVQQGADFDCRDGIVLAVDNVDGDLSKLSFTWWEETSKPVDTTKNLNGKDASYTVKVRIYDLSGNYSDISYSLVVVADKYTPAAGSQVESISKEVQEITGTLNDLVDNQDALTSKVNGLESAIAGLEELVSADSAKLESLNTTVTNLETQVNTVADAVSSKCGNGTALVLQIAGAAALLALVLRKRH